MAKAMLGIDWLVKNRNKGSLSGNQGAQRKQFHTKGLFVGFSGSLYPGASSCNFDL